MADMVQIRNPGLPPADPATVSREAFEQHFAAQGFVIVNDNGDPMPEAPAAKLPTRPRPEGSPA